MRVLSKRIALTCVLLMVGSCATTKVEPLRADHVPDIATDEGGLWAQSEKFEKLVAHASERENDAALNAYLKELVCRIAADLCDDIRIYVFRISQPNAFMTPNGMLAIYSGMLLRLENEAQLVEVLGHEIGHYRNRHSLENFRKTKQVAAVFTPVMGVAGLAGGSGAALLVAVGAGARLAAYSRDQEREADDEGFKALQAMGYDTNAAWQIWAYLRDEEKYIDRGFLEPFFASHPSSTERLARLRERAALANVKPNASASNGYIAVVAPFVRAWLQDELALRQYARTEVLLTRLRNAATKPAEWDFALAELYRKRGAADDQTRAITKYLAAQQDPTAPVQSFRELGILYQKLGQKEKARMAFKQYLLKATAATDKAMVESYLNELK
jgi:beta-barrel assembly-enhancing protease